MIRYSRGVPNIFWSVILAMVEQLSLSLSITLTQQPESCNPIWYNALDGLGIFLSKISESGWLGRGVYIENEWKWMAMLVVLSKNQWKTHINIIFQRYWGNSSVEDPPAPVSQTYLGQKMVPLARHASGQHFLTINFFGWRASSTAEKLYPTTWFVVYLVP